MIQIILQIKMLLGKNITVYEDVTKYRLNKDFWLDEIECYHRLKSCEQVPELISSNQEELSITTPYCGESLFILTAVKKNKNIPIDDPVSQIVNFINECKKNNIVHLDCHPGNVLVKDRKLYIIDFEKVAIDNKTSSAKCNKKYKKFIANGGWNWIINRYTEYFKEFDNYIWFNEHILQKGIEKYG